MEKLKKLFPLSVKFSKTPGQTALCAALYVVAAVVISLFILGPVSNVLSWIVLIIFVPLFFLAYILVSIVISLLSFIFAALDGNLASIILTCLGVIIFFVLLFIFLKICSRNFPDFFFCGIVIFLILLYDNKYKI
jgi:hypothetical protein